jgi:hypothetical protein
VKRNSARRGRRIAWAAGSAAAACGLAAGCSVAAAPAAARRPVDTAPFVYAVNTKSNTISQYSASPSDFGALKPLAPSTVPTGPFPYGIGIDPRGTSV